MGLVLMSDSSVKRRFPHSSRLTWAAVPFILLGMVLTVSLQLVFGGGGEWASVLLVPALALPALLIILPLFQQANSNSRDSGEQTQVSPIRYNQEAVRSLDSFFEMAPIIIGVLDLEDSKIVQVYDTPAATRFFDMLRAQARIEGTTERSETFRNIIELWILKCRESQETKDAVKFEFPIAAGHEARWFTTTIFALLEQSGPALRCCYSVEDVTDIKNKESALRATQDTLELALDAGTLGYWDWHIPSGHVKLGGCWASMLGERLEDIEPHVSSWKSRVHPEDLPLAHAALQRHLSGEASEYVCEHRLRKKDGSWVWVLDRGRVVERDSEGVPIRAVGLHADVTEAQAIREQLKTAAKRKDEFLATLAHELRNPLAPIRTGLRILRANPTGENAEQTREMMERQVSHMVRLIDDLLDVSRITRGQLELRKEEVAVQAIIDSAIESSAPAIEAGGHTLTVTPLSEPVMIYGDPTRLAQIISNLLINSTKYTPRGGRISLALSCEGDQMTVKVEDNGIGIPPGQLDSIFEMFGRVEQANSHSQGGLGIGLSLVRKFVDLHGGTVRAESKGLGLGSAFIVQLPLLKSMGSAGEQHAA